MSFINTPPSTRVSFQNLSFSYEDKSDESSFFKPLLEKIIPSFAKAQEKRSPSQGALILKKISADLYPGQLILLTGPSGSGKTTLLTLIGTLRQHQEGQLKVLGHLFPKTSKNSALFQSLRSQIGFIFQEHHVLMALTALENVMMALDIHPAHINAPEKEKRALALASLKKVGLEPWADRPPQKMSGGQRQRIAIARALVHEPSLILADEPTASLDLTHAQQVMHTIKKHLLEKGASCLMITHDHRLYPYADGFWTMEEGCLTVKKTQP